MIISDSYDIDIHYKRRAKKRLLLAPLFLTIHFIFIQLLFPVIDTQAAIIGTFFCAIFAWITGFKFGLIYTILSAIISNLSFYVILSERVINNTTLFGILSYFAATLISAYVSDMHNRLKKTQSLLEQEHNKTEMLLSNILPVSIAKRLKNGESLIADKYIESTILFCDLVGFTKFSREHSAEIMVGLLDELISSFDKLSDSFGLEKIKTIGDAYLVVSGLPEERTDHASAIADMALSMAEVLDDFNKKHNLDLQIRAGIHSGPVIGGVIGTHKFTFDIWGDTVNLASRMESHGESGKIQITGETYNLLKSDYNLKERGIIDVKNIGPIKTWYLESKK